MDTLKVLLILANTGENRNGLYSLNISKQRFKHARKVIKFSLKEVCKYMFFIKNLQAGQLQHQGGTILENIIEVCKPIDIFL